MHLLHFRNLCWGKYEKYLGICEQKQKSLSCSNIHCAIKGPQLVYGLCLCMAIVMTITRRAPLTVTSGLEKISRSCVKFITLSGSCSTINNLKGFGLQNNLQLYMVSCHLSIGPANLDVFLACWHELVTKPEDSPSISSLH